jgi:DNA-binding transcriptional regulator YdaS (Cro superfamily)
MQKIGKKSYSIGVRQVLLLVEPDLLAQWREGRRQLTISGGKLNISVTGVSDGSEGLESKAILTVTGGEVERQASTREIPLRRFRA